MKSPTKTIWKTVVLSAALLGGGACSKNKNEMTDPCKDPCKDKMHEDGGDAYGGDEYGEGAWGEYGDDDVRSRGGDDGGGDVGRGFVLS
jgi:hypothetical protein